MDDEVEVIDIQVESKHLVLDEIFGCMLSTEITIILTQENRCID